MQWQGDFACAEELFGESLRLFQTLGGLQGIDVSMIGLANVAGACGQSERGATLLGAVAALAERVSFGGVLVVKRPIESDRALQVVRAQLDEATFEAAWAKGQAMTREQAIAYALARDFDAGAPRPVAT